MHVMPHLLMLMHVCISSSCHHADVGNAWDGAKHVMHMYGGTI
jgi:hypothetical protein